MSSTSGMSSSASNRCSTVMYSLRFSRARRKGSFRQNSRSRLNMSGGALSALFHRAQQGMLVLPRIGVHLGHLRLSDLVGVDAAHALAPGMHFEHDSRGLGPIHTEDPLQHIDDELHRSVVVVQQNDPEKRRPLELGPRLLSDRSLLRVFLLVGHLAPPPRDSLAPAPPRFTPPACPLASAAVIL